MTTRHGFISHAFLLLVLSLSLGLAGCEGDDGAPGADGADGVAGADGQSCWDLNANGIGDLPDEDINNDNVVDVYDCNGFAQSGAYEISQLHVGFFTDNLYEGTQSCLNCHGLMAEELLTTAHFQWQGVVANIEGVVGEIHGKRDILNNFCIAVPSNEGRCTQCHAGYGWADNTFDFEDPENIDCLVCHDQTGTYAKAPTTAGLPADGVDLQAVARSVAMNEGKPTIDNCIFCHSYAGGGDNVKHGDLALSLENTTYEYDVHMGQDGVAQYECIDCHSARDVNQNFLGHGIGGMPYHSVEEGFMKSCEFCHGTAANIHAGTTVQRIVNLDGHSAIACQVCHIPAIARETPTKTEWYWERAGTLPMPADTDPVTGRPLWDNKKGDFVWAYDVRPSLRRFNGTWEKMIINVNDTYAVGEGTPENPVVLGAPVGSRDDGMIYPFKKMIGNQPADVVNRRILVPHLFGTAGGDNPFWGTWDWDLALLDAAAITGQPYEAGDYGFVNTEMYLSVNHEVAPPEMAFGMDGDCNDCHFGDQIEWAALGWTDDPAEGGDPVP